MVRFKRKADGFAEQMSLEDAYRLVGNLIAAEPQPALFITDQLIEQHPQNMPLQWMKAYILEALSAEYEYSLAFCEKALDIDDSHIQLAQMKGDLLRKLGRHQDSIDWLTSCLQNFPNSWEIHMTLGMCFLETGQSSEAETEMRTALKFNKHCVYAWFSLIGISRFSRRDLNQMLATKNKKASVFRNSDLAHLNFAIAAYWRQQGDMQREVDLLHQANGCTKRDAHYDSAQDQQRASDHIESFDRTYFQQQSTNFSGLVNRELPKPIFIVGMPRCGSTLLEQILSSHPKIVATGESCVVETSLSRVLSRADNFSLKPSMLPMLDKASLHQFTSEYNKLVAKLVTPDAIYTDKSLDNFRVIGLLKSIFPEAKIIDMTRHPLDIILSCYQSGFYDVPYASDLTFLAEYYVSYRKIMKHWESVFEQPFLKVKYSELVSNTEQEVRRLCDYCEVDWDPAMLKFTSSANNVNTMSRTQVRKGMYSSSVNRWKPYRKMLQPAIDVLKKEGLLKMALT